MLVHITLNLKEDEVDAKGDAVLASLQEAGVRDIDTKFLKRYSLLSGQVARRHLRKVEALPDVAAVEPDGEVVAI